MLERSITTARKPTISAQNDALLPPRVRSTEVRLENPAKVHLLQEIATYDALSFDQLKLTSQ